MKKIFADTKKYFCYIVYSGRAELRAEVANSYLNWLWWIIEPVCFMLVYSVVFGYVFGATEEYHSIFVFIGITVWDFFNRMLTDSVRIVKNNKSIVSRVYLPKYIFLLIKAYVNAFKMLISFGVVLIMMLLYKVPLSFKIIWLIPIVIVLFFVTFGACAFLLHFGVFVEDLSNVLRIFLRIMFYFTGVFYNVEKLFGNKLGEQFGTLFMECNPIALVITSTREVLLYGHVPHYMWLLIWLIIGVIISGVGIRLIYKNENSYVKVI